MNVRSVDAAQLHLKGPLKDAATFLVPARLVAHLGLQADSDDLDDLQAAFFEVDGVPVTVRRYAGNPENEFTLAVDLVSAEAYAVALADVIRLVVQQRFDLPESSIVWRRPMPDVPAKMRAAFG